LHSFGIFTAYDYSIQNDNWIKKNFTVQGLKLVMELRGISCIPIEEIAPDKKGMCVSRSFGQMIEDLETLEESVSTYANMASEKLRKQNSNCSTISVFIHTNQFRADLKQYYRSQVVQLPIATNNASEIISASLMALRLIYKKGYLYKKAGIFIDDISPDSSIQTSLFDAEPVNKKKLSLNSTVDLLNKVMGRNVVKYAIMGNGVKWKLRQEMKSPCYTTRIDEVPIIKI
jgi:DNA polymerase V